MKLLGKLLTTYLVLTTLGVVVLGARDLWSFDDYFRGMAQTGLKARGIALSDSVRRALEQRDQTRLAGLVRDNAYPDGITVRVIAPDGALLASSAPFQDRQLLDWNEIPGVPAALHGRSSTGVARGIFARGDRYFHARPVYSHGKVIAALRLSLTLDRFQREQRGNLFAVGMTALFTLLIGSGVSLWLARGLSNPIRRMRDFAVNVGAGHFGQELAIERRDELGELAEELARMSQRLASADAERRLFLANVSHELRTPVTNMEVALEALAGADDASAGIRERFLRAAQGELGRLRHLVQDLLELGRLEAGGVLDLEVTSLESVVAEVACAIMPRLEAQDLQLRVELPEVYVEVDEARMAQVFMNLLDNAVKFAAKATEISVCGEAQRELVLVHVRNAGAGIPPDELSRVFEPLYVGDPSRTGHGTGLGLAIARRIVEAHGGHVTVTSQQGVGATFTVCLPIVQVE